MDMTAPILAASLSALVWLFFIRRHDRLRPEPLKYLIRALLLGGIISVIPASLLNDLFLGWLGGLNQAGLGHWTIMIMLASFIGLNEEFFKAWATIKLTAKRPEFDEPIDGPMYAMSVALGFAFLENIGYLYRYGWTLIISRSLLSVPIHLTCGAIIGYGISRAKFGRSGPVKVRSLGGYYLAAAAAHALYDLAVFNLSELWPVGLGLLMGLIAYTRRLLKRLNRLGPDSPPGICPACRRILPSGADTCPNCGLKIESAFQARCPACGAPRPPDRTPCPACGVTPPPPL